MEMESNETSMANTPKQPAARVLWMICLLVAVIAGFSWAGWSLIRGGVRGEPAQNTAPSASAPEGFFSKLSGWFGSGKKQVEVLMPPPRLRLDGISTEPPRAMLNRQLIRAGESVEGVLILDIHKESIRVEYQGQQGTLKVGDTLTSKTLTAAE